MTTQSRILGIWAILFPSNSNCGLARRIEDCNPLFNQGLDTWSGNCFTAVARPTGLKRKSEGDNMSWRLLAVTVCIAGLSCIPASAQFVIDFSGGSGGAISYNSTTGTLTTTTDLPITAIDVSGAPANNGIYTVADTLVITATGGSFSGGVFSFTGGTFAIDGTFTPAGITTSTALVTGTITSLTIGPESFGLAPLDLNGSDTKNATLVAYFCPSCGPSFLLPHNFQTSTLTSIVPTTAFTTGSSFTADTFSTDLPNVYVPEASSSLLFGTLLVGITLLVRRRRATL